jgi:predicted HTH transcriptional regulator
LFILSELHDICVEEFSLGRRFYIPEIGYFSMSASLDMPKDNPDKKITGMEVSITGINFRPEAKLLEQVQRNTHFVRSKYTSQSTQYTEEKLLAKIKEYLQENRYVTTRILRILFGLTPYMAQKWLNHFCEKGIMVKEGTQHAPIYFLK